MQYAWNMARFLSHEAKQLISCLILKALKQNSPFQARKTWYILCSSSHLDKTALNAEKLDAPYVKYASFIKSWSKTTHFKGGSREAYRVLRPIKRDRVLHRHVQYAWNMPFSPDQKNKKKMANVHFLHLVNFTEFCPFYIRYYFVSSVGICQNRIPGIGLFNLSWSRPFLSWFCLAYLSSLDVSW